LIQIKNFQKIKPNIGMINSAQNKWNIDLNKSLFIGDKHTDKLTAIKAGIKCKILRFEKYQNNRLVR